MNKTDLVFGDKMVITEYQKELMKHTISDRKRNWFGTSKNCKNGIEFEKLVKVGLTTSETPPAWMGDEVIYRLTRDGKNAILSRLTPTKSN